MDRLRSADPIGNLRAEGCVDPALHTSGTSSGGRTVDATQSRRRPSIIRLCGVVRLWNTGSRPHTGEGCIESCVHDQGGGLSGSSTGACNWDVT